MRTSFRVVVVALLLAILGIASTYAVYRYRRDAAEDAERAAMAQQMRGAAAATQAHDQAILDEARRRAQAHRNEDPTITFRSQR
ncbi:hypothetical protein [Ralstonia sp.]|uniref:hypothetical protein n=1 Tax=unclassified Ralstonia TaxID=209769 RepID=UPI0031D12AA6